MVSGSPTRKPSLGGSLAYLLLALLNGLPWVVLLLPLTLVGMVATVVWLGIPILMLVTMAWRGVARMERRWIRKTLGVDIPTPYRRPPAGSWFRRWRAKLRDPATWRDVSYILLRLPLCVIEFGLTVALWVYAIVFTVTPLLAWLLPTRWALVLPLVRSRSGDQVSMIGTVPYALTGVIVLLLAIVLTPRIAQFQAVLARALLGPTAAATLTARAEHLQASRARGVDAAEAERRRIERDLHDGAQQRLVAVAMALGRAKTKLDNDPEALRDLIEEAHADAKLAVAELRDLARGIYPAVLGDRGLDAALSALAGRCPLPVDVRVDVRPRPPTAVESTAYFIVAEALTNAVKHAAAEQLTVRLTRTRNTVTVEVSDNGRGGAVIRPGGGLAGLADRAATIDGVVTVESPPGGPTKLRAELPCEW